ncbi:MAG: biotin/lipoyl-containing protein [Anaerolineae bacterium]
MRFTYQMGDQVYTLDVEKKNQGYRASLNGETYEIEFVRSEPGGLSFILGDHSHLAHVAVDGANRWVFMDGRSFVLKAPTPVAGRTRGAAGHAGSGDKLVLSPMPGQVRAVQVEQNASVEKGETLLLLEAMKMEIRVQSPRAGRVTRLLVQQGQTVDRDQVLVELE